MPRNPSLALAILSHQSPAKILALVMQAPLPPRYHPNGIICHRVAKRSRYAKVWYRNQEISPFLRLPAEIRCMIYEFLLGGKTIYVESRPKDDTTLFRWGFQCVVYRQGVNPYDAELQCEEKRPPFEKGMTLLNAVCRQLYKETAFLPYKRNTWAFAYRRVFLDFAGPRGPLPPPHRRSFRSLFLLKLPAKPELKPLIGVKTIWLDDGHWVEKYDVETSESTHRTEKTAEEVKRSPDERHRSW